MNPEEEREALFGRLLDEAWLVEASAGTVQGLLARGADLRATDPVGQTPLHVAAAVGRADLAALLLEGGAEVGARDENAASPPTWKPRTMRGKGRSTGRLAKAWSRRWSDC